MRIVLLLAAASLAWAQTGSDDVDSLRRHAAGFARAGDFQRATADQEKALLDCQKSGLLCPSADVAVLRAELAGYYVQGGYPEAAIPLWRRNILQTNPDEPMHNVSRLGLAVALFSAGNQKMAVKMWTELCHKLRPASLEAASCRFSLAVAGKDHQPVWSELEQLLPRLMQAPGAQTRVTALLQTADAARLEGRRGRALNLVQQAQGIIETELGSGHPDLAWVYHLRAALNPGEAKRWNKLARRSAEKSRGWQRPSVSVADLRKEGR